MEAHCDPKAEVSAILKSIREHDPSRCEELMTGVKELKELHDAGFKSRQERNPLLIGSKLERLRFLFTGSSDAVRPQTETGRKWGRFLRVHLQGAGLSETTTYRRLEAWQSAKSLGIPEAVILRIAQDKRMLGVGIDKENPLGQRYTASATRLAGECTFRTPECAGQFIERVFQTPKPETKTNKPSILLSMHNSTLRGIHRMMKLDGRETTDQKVVAKYLHDHISNLLLGFGHKEGVSFHPAAEFPSPAFQTWQAQISTDVDAKVKREERTRNAAQRLQKKRDRKAHAKARTQRKTVTQAAVPIVRTIKPAQLTPDRTETIHGLYAELNKKTRFESTPWEIKDQENPTKVLVRFCSLQDAEMELKKLREAHERTAKNAVDFGGNKRLLELGPAAAS
jgi:hypothetical protein